MSRFWKNILCLVFSCCLYTSAKCDDLDPASQAYLSDKKYAKNIEVKAYLATKDQVARLFSEENGKITQKTNKELYGREIFLVVRCKNFGDYRSFGILNCQLPNSDGPISIEIMMMPGYMKSFRDTVLPLYGGGVPNNNTIPVITFEWKSLYTI